MAADLGAGEAFQPELLTFELPVQPHDELVLVVVADIDLAQPGVPLRRALGEVLEAADGLQRRAAVAAARMLEIEVRQDLGMVHPDAQIANLAPHILSGDQLVQYLDTEVLPRRRGGGRQRNRNPCKSPAPCGSEPAHHVLFSSPRRRPIQSGTVGARAARMS